MIEEIETYPMPQLIDPLSQSEMRDELLTFKDGSEIKVNARMRHDSPLLYARACKKAVCRFIMGENKDKSVAL